MSAKVCYILKYDAQNELDNLWSLICVQRLKWTKENCPHKQIVKKVSEEKRANSLALELYVETILLFLANVSFIYIYIPNNTIGKRIMRFS